MNTYAKKIGLALLVSLPIVALLIFFDLQKQDSNINEKTNDVVGEYINPIFDQEYINKSCVDCQETTTEIIQTQPLKHTAWIPPWDYNNGANTLNNSEIEFESISPVTFSVNTDGTLNSRLETNLTLLRDKNVNIIPTISNFDWQVMKEIFDSSENTKRHINSIVNIVESNNYDGIDLDYESISISNKDHFREFIKELSTKLHEKDKILSITVLPQWGDEVIYTGLAETRQVQDWQYIGQHADQVRIMTYDFTQSGSSTPGPIAPINWVEKVLGYAVEKIPREKIWLGIHLYSYEWVMPTQDAQSQAIKTNSYTYETIQKQILTLEDIHVQYNTEFQEGYADYKCQKNNYCILYYATPESVKARQNLATKYNIAGVTYWRLGGQGDLLTLN